MGWLGNEFEISISSELKALEQTQAQRQEALRNHRFPTSILYADRLQSVRLINLTARAKDVRSSAFPALFEIQRRFPSPKPKYDAIICLNCLLRGDAPRCHRQRVARGISRSARN